MEIKKLSVANPEKLLCLNGIGTQNFLNQNITHKVEECEKDNFAIRKPLAANLAKSHFDKKWKSSFAQDIGGELYKRFEVEYFGTIDQYGLTDEGILDINNSLPITYNNSFTETFMAQFTSAVPFYESPEVSEKITIFPYVSKMVDEFYVPNEEQIVDIPEVYKKNIQQESSQLCMFTKIFDFSKKKSFMSIKVTSFIHQAAKYSLQQRSYSIFSQKCPIRFF